jgi:hypothetical protein
MLWNVKCDLLFLPLIWTKKPPFTPVNVVWNCFAARNKHHTISFINARINIGKGGRGSSFFVKCVTILKIARLYFLTNFRSTNIWPWLSESVTIFKLCFYLIKTQENRFYLDYGFSRTFYTKAEDSAVMFQYDLCDVWRV